MPWNVPKRFREKELKQWSSKRKQDMTSNNTVSSYSPKLYSPQRYATTRAFWRQCASCYKNIMETSPVTTLWPGSNPQGTEDFENYIWEDYDYVRFHRNRLAYCGDGWTEVEERSTSSFLYGCDWLSLLRMGRLILAMQLKRTERYWMLRMKWILLHLCRRK